MYNYCCFCFTEAEAQALCTKTAAPDDEITVENEKQGKFHLYILLTQYISIGLVVLHILLSSMKIDNYMVFAIMIINCIITKKTSINHVILC